MQQGIGELQIGSTTTPFRGAPKAPALATGLLQRLAAQGRSLRKDGAALAEPDAARQEAQMLAEQFLATRLPEWQRLGVWA